MSTERRIEHRRFSGAELRVAGEGGKKQIRGYSAVYNQEAIIGGTRWGFREVVRPGAFARALRGDDDVRCLFNHQSDLVLGRTASKTLRLYDDPTGLRMECDPPDTSGARDVMMLIERGDVTGQSFSWTTIRDRWTFSGKDGEMDFRELLEVELIDVGPVTFPAYSGTEVGVRGAGPDEDTIREILERARREAGEDCPRLRRARLAMAEAGLA